MQSAFWAVTAHDSLEEAIIAAVNLGQDSDTTGAVAGALAGARWGMADIPQRWLDVLRNREELLGLADGLFDLSG
jgi:ADP-ribosyl-[dinitrogen reductase] hydrolase